MSLKYGYLLLKPLSSITDEDSFEVAKIITGRKLQSDVQSYIKDAKEEIQRFGSVDIWRRQLYTSWDKINIFFNLVIISIFTMHKEENRVLNSIAH